MTDAYTSRDVAALDGPAVREARDGRAYIAVIGIDRYREWNRLNNAVSDAGGALKLFTELGFELVGVPLFDELATGDALRRLVVDDLSGLGAEDSLVLFFAGHGHTVTRTYDRTTVKDGYIIPVDGAGLGGRAGTWIRLESWLTDITRIPARHILVVLDACHSGLALGPIVQWRRRGGASRRRGPLEQLRVRRSRRIITSALDDQLAMDSGPMPGHSLFTGCLIEGMTGGLAAIIGQPVVTGSEIGHYVQRRVSEYPGSVQTPDFGALELDDRGELLVRVAMEVADMEGTRPTAAAIQTSAASFQKTIWRWFIGGGAAALAVGAVVIGLAMRAEAVHKVESLVANHVRDANAMIEDAQRVGQQRDATRVRAFALFDSNDWNSGETVWSESEVLAAEEAGRYRAASGHLEAAMSLDPTRAGLRALFADLAFQRLLRAEQDHQGDLAAELLGRLRAYDDGRYSDALGASAQVELEVMPSGTRVWSERPDSPPELLGQAPLPRLALRPGSVILSFDAPGRMTTRLPVLLSRGDTLKQRISLPAADLVSPGMIYVPPGRFLFGSTDTTEVRRGFFKTLPLHEVQTDAYYIGRYEVTFGEWIEFLEDLTPTERRRLSPSVTNPHSSLTLIEIAPKRWRLELTPTTRTYIAETGQRLRYERRTRRAEQDWTRFPVAAISYNDAVAYTTWLDRTGRIPGARLCNEYEWERAARGADARPFSNGNALAPDDANIDVTYGRDPLAFGPDEVGSHPASRSPIGADDMVGNVWEWTRSIEILDGPVQRGGGWYHSDVNARSMNREPGEPTQRHVYMGMRVCATPR